MEGILSRGRDGGIGRKEVIYMKQTFEDYEEIVGVVGYVLENGWSWRDVL